MKTAFDNYTRLAKSLLGMSSLWQGLDHIVYVRGSGIIRAYSEEYLRYRFRDIQAFTVTKTSRIGFAALYLLGALFFAGIIGLVLTFRENEPMELPMILLLSALSLPTLISLLLLLRHFILGPTCHCFIQTSLKTDRIRPLSRLHTATQCIEAISEKLNESQSALAVSSPTNISSEKAVSTVSSGENQLRLPFFTRPTFFIFAFYALLILGSLHLESTALAALSIAAIILGSVALIVTLISSIRFSSPESIRTILWLILGLVFLDYGAAIVYFVYAVNLDPIYTLDIAGPLEAFAGAATVGGVGFYICFLVLAISMLVASIIGIVNSLKWKTRIETVNQTPPEPANPID